MKGKVSGNCYIDKERWIRPVDSGSAKQLNTGGKRALNHQHSTIL